MRIISRPVPSGDRKQGAHDANRRSRISRRCSTANIAGDVREMRERLASNCLAQARIQETLRTLAQERRPVNEGCQQSSLTQEANKRQCAGGWVRRSPGVVGA